MQFPARTIAARRIPAWAPALLLAAMLVPAAALANGDRPGAPGFDHSAFDALLAKYVTPAGVRYRAWHDDDADRRALASYVERLAAARPSELSSAGALAFWIDAYNALTLRLILDNYPLKSIKDLDTPWERKLITVEGRELSLDDIENDVIRKDWQEPRVHFALSCASKGCPPLRPEAYTGARLDEQLEDQARAFLSDGRTNFLDADGKLHLSDIFDWYREDFETDGRTLVDWLRPYLPALAALPERKSPKIEFARYDWNLNEATE